MADISGILTKYPRSPEHLLNILHEIQDEEPRNYLRAEALRAAAAHVGIPLSRVVSTASFYTMFSLKPRGVHIIRVCESPPCLLAGGERLIAFLKERLGVEVGETSEDGLFTLETTSCLGACAGAPAVMIDKTVYESVTEDRLDEILAGLRGEDA